MAISFVELYGSAQSKAGDTNLGVGSVGSGGDTDVLVGDDLFLAVAGEPGILTGLVVNMASGTANFTDTIESSHDNVGNVAVALIRCAITQAGTIASITVSWTNSNAAKAAVGGIFRGVGAADGVYDSEADGLGAVFTMLHSDTPWQTGDLVIGAAGWEGPNGDNLSASGSPSLGTVSEVAQMGTTGGGAASNITAQLHYAIATANSSGGNAMQSDNSTSSRDAAGAGGVYSEAAVAALERTWENEARIYDPALARAILRRRGR